METIKYIDRRNTNCSKWDGQKDMFGAENLLALWVADMDFEVPECVKKALHEYVEIGAFGYYSVPDSYYQAFIDWEEKHHGYKIKKEWIRFSPGIVAAFNWMIRILSEPGDAVIVNTPVYYPFLHAVKNNGRKLITSELVNENGVYSIDFEDFEKQITEHEVKVFILCSPHNPAGRVWTREELARLFEICVKHQVYIVADEIHQDLVADGYKHISAQLVGDYHDRIVTLKAPSKTFNLAGGQNSLIVIEDEAIREKWDSFTTKIRIGRGNPFGYVAAEAAYRGGEEWLAGIRKIIWDNYEYLKERLKKELPETVVTPLEGTYLCWVDISAYLQGEDPKVWVQDRAKLAVDYGEWFGGKAFEGFIRINLATSKENVAEAIDRLVREKI